MKTLNNIKTIWKTIIIIVVSVIIGMIIGNVFLSGSGSGHEGHDHDVTEKSEPTTYTCSMHPQIRQEEPGLCPICAMDLVPISSMESDDEEIGMDEIQLTPSAIQLANVQTEMVRNYTAVKPVYLSGKVEADERNINRITARFEGRIDKLLVNFIGQQLEKGQKLMTIYSPELITAQQEMLEAKMYRETNPSFYNATRSKLKLWGLTEKQIDEIELAGEPEYYLDILSPVSGTVTKRHVSAGDYVKEGTQLLEVIDLSRLWVMFDAYESDLPWIKEGDVISFEVQALPGKSFSSRVSFVDPFIDPVSRVAQLRVEIDNPGMQLKPEMFANGTLESEISDASGQLIIPKSSVLWTGKRAIVYVKVEDKEMPTFQYREIVLGPDAGDHYIVASGLHEGEEIAVNGVFKIDAAAQLAGKSSMMNPGGGKSSVGHDHGSMDMGTHSQEVYKDIDKEHIMITVYGNCGMCKERIENAAHTQPGVLSANWVSEPQKLHLSYDASILDPMDVEKAIAAVGHDTENQRAPDEVYEKLHACCLYERPWK
jgi:Cu(I)/Ag(I) efflux system membrane fusion protein